MPRRPRAMADTAACRDIVVAAGVSGAGKTTFGRALAERLGVPFEEGDALHSPENIAKMRRGVPLDDADRVPWLDAVAAWIDANLATGGVVSCSALKRAYRDRLRASGHASLRFVLLSVDAATLRARLAVRRNHFMPASLLDSQLATLEPPIDEPDVHIVDGTAPTPREVKTTLAWLQGGASGAQL